VIKESSVQKSCVSMWSPCWDADGAKARFDQLMSVWLDLKHEHVALSPLRPSSVDGNVAKLQGTYELLRDLADSVSYVGYRERENEVYSEVLFDFHGDLTHLVFSYEADEALVGSGGKKLEGKVELQYSSESLGSVTYPLLSLDTRRRGYLGDGLPALGSLPVVESISRAAHRAIEAVDHHETREETGLKYALGLSVPFRELDQPQLPMSELWLLLAIAAAPGSFHEHLHGMLLEFYGEHASALTD